jgi:hypothetical protein
MNPPSLTPFERMMEQMNSLPLWIKQVIYVQLRAELEKILTKVTVDSFADAEVLQMMVPQINHLGRQELERPTGQVPVEILKLLYWSAQGKSVMNICVINQWTLEQCCGFLFTAIERGLIIAPGSIVIQATLLYMGGKIRLGDYLVKTGRLKLEQLDQALRTQRYIEESLGERTGIGNIFINLGYIHKQDCEGILFLKEESKKPFPPDLMMEPSPGADLESVNRLKQELSQAQARIQQLQAQLQQQQMPASQQPPQRGLF